MAGRPPKRSPERREAILQTLRLGNTRHAAAERVGMARTSLTRWMAADASFRAAVEEAEAHAETRFETVIADSAFGRPAQYDERGRLIRAEVLPSPKWAAWWLARRRRSDYGASVTVDVQRLVADAAQAEGLPESELMAEVEAYLRGQRT